MDGVPVEALGPFLDQASAGRLTTASHAWRAATVVAHLRSVIVTPQTPALLLRGVEEAEVRRSEGAVEPLRGLGPRLWVMRLREMDGDLLGWLAEGGAPLLHDLACWTTPGHAEPLMEAAARGCPLLRNLFVSIETPHHFLVRRAPEKSIAARVDRLPHLQNLAIVGDVFHDRLDLYHRVPRVVVVASQRCLDRMRTPGVPRPPQVVALVRPPRSREDRANISYARCFLTGVRVRVTHS